MLGSDVLIHLVFCSRNSEMSVKTVCLCLCEMFIRSSGEITTIRQYL